MAWDQLLSGAASGAAAGSALGPWGALAGGVLGGALGGLSTSPEEAQKRAMSNYQGQMANAMGQYQSSQQAALQPYSSLYTPEGVSASKTAYTSAAGAANPSQYAVDQGTGNQQYTSALDSWEKYLDPSISLQQEAARKNVEESAAGQGGLYSGAAAREIAQDTADIASQGYQQALQNAASEETRKNQAATQNLQNQMAAGNYNVGLGQTNLSNLKDVYGTEREAMDAYTSGLSDLNKSLYSGQTAAANAALQSALGTSGGTDVWGNILNAAKAGQTVKSLWG